LNARGTGPIRLLLVDSQLAVRKGLGMRFALEEDLEVVGEAGDGAEAISLARTLHPDVILIDIDIPGGIALTEALRSSSPRSAVVILTLHDDAATRERATEAGVVAFVTKHQTEEALLAAIRGAQAARTNEGRHDRTSANREEEHTNEPDDMRERRDL